MVKNGESLAKSELREEIMVAQTEIWIVSKSESNLSRDLNHTPFYSPSSRPKL